MNTTDTAAPTDAEQAATLQRVYDLIGMGKLARTPGVLLANIENALRRADCLSGIEQLFTYEVPDEDYPEEMTDECDLNWGQDRAEYVETFKAALPAFIARNPALATTPQTDGATAALTDEQIINIADSYSFTWDEGIIAFARALFAATHAPAMAETVSDAARDVLAERQRQVTAEGWTPEHDDAHDMGEMAHAAAWYAVDQMMRNALDERGLSFWPWAQEWWKPSTPRRDLVKAGALILAEIERIDRAAASGGEQETGK